MSLKGTIFTYEWREKPPFQQLDGMTHGFVDF